MKPYVFLLEFSMFYVCQENKSPILPQENIAFLRFFVNTKLRYIFFKSLFYFLSIYLCTTLTSCTPGRFYKQESLINLFASAGDGEELAAIEKVKNLPSILIEVCEFSPILPYNANRSSIYYFEFII
jgi:hypothetical protein